MLLNIVSNFSISHCLLSKKNENQIIYIIYKHILTSKNILLTALSIMFDLYKVIRVCKMNNMISALTI